MDETTQAIVKTFQERFGAQTDEFRGEVSLILPPAHIQAACQALRDEFEFNLLSEETAVDYWGETSFGRNDSSSEQSPRFHVVYRIRSLPRNQIIGLRVPLDGNAPVMPSITSIYANADWFERELWDMFGIRFEGHPDLRRIVMPYDWVGHPLRKDYPLGYEEVQFSFNFDEIDERKPYAQE